jgi:hypothetical protein
MLRQYKEKAKEVISKSVDKINLLMFEYANSYMFRAAMEVRNCIQPHVQTFCQTPYVELSQVRQCIIIRMDMCSVIRAAVKYGRVHEWKQD